MRGIRRAVGSLCVLIAVALGLLLPSEAAHWSLATAVTKAIVIDTDMAPDDWMAILYLLQRSDVDVKAISITGTGETHCDPGARNALNLVGLVKGTRIPITCGRQTPLQGSHAFPASWRRYADSMAGFQLPRSPHDRASETAVQLLTSVIEGSPQKITLVTLGPLTNVAEALQQTPSLAGKLEMVYIMGGAVDVAGNVELPGVKETVAEWNIYVDPYAAEVVFRSGTPITLVPLDCSNHVPVTMTFYERLQGERTTPAANFVYQILGELRGFIQSGGYYFWDPLAAAMATDESVTTISVRTLSINTDEGPESGRTKPDPSGANVRVCMKTDKSLFETMFLNTLNGRSN